jgi:hypothetical protein
VYVSFTVEAGAEDGTFPSGTVGVLNDTGFDVGGDGSFEITVGGPPRDRAWLPLAPDASRLTVRHYWEAERSPWQPPVPDLGLAIELVEGTDAVPAGPAAPSDATVAAAIRRMGTYVRSRTLEIMARPGEADPPAFVSRLPHVFPAPVTPGAHALAAADAAYSMAPYLLGPDGRSSDAGALAGVPVRQRQPVEPPAPDLRLPPQPGQPQPGPGPRRARRDDHDGHRPP